MENFKRTVLPSTAEEDEFENFLERVGEIGSIVEGMNSKNPIVASKDDVSEADCIVKENKSGINHKAFEAGPSKPGCSDQMEPEAFEEHVFEKDARESFPGSGASEVRGKRAGEILLDSDTDSDAISESESEKGRSNAPKISKLLSAGEDGSASSDKKDEYSSKGIEVGDRSGRTGEGGNNGLKASRALPPERICIEWGQESKTVGGSELVQHNGGETMPKTVECPSVKETPVVRKGGVRDSYKAKEADVRDVRPFVRRRGVDRLRLTPRPLVVAVTTEPDRVVPVSGTLCGGGESNDKLSVPPRLVVAVTTEPDRVVPVSGTLCGGGESNDKLSVPPRLVVGVTTEPDRVVPVSGTLCGGGESNDKLSVPPRLVVGVTTEPDRVVPVSGTLCGGGESNDKLSVPPSECDVTPVTDATSEAIDNSSVIPPPDL